MRTALATPDHEPAPQGRYVYSTTSQAGGPSMTVLLHGPWPQATATATWIPGRASASTTVTWSAA